MKSAHDGHRIAVVEQSETFYRVESLEPDGHLLLIHVDEHEPETRVIGRAELRCRTCDVQVAVGELAEGTDHWDEI
jgi:hypothetical protein